MRNVFIGLAAFLPLTLLVWNANAQGCLGTPALHHSVDRLIEGCEEEIHSHTRLGGAGALPETRAEGYYDLGLLHQLSGKLDLAVADYSSAIGWQHDDGDAYAARGDAYTRMGQPEKALDDYAQAGKLVPLHWQDARERCWVRAVRGYPLDRAIADCNEALKLDPANPAVLATRCYANFRAGHYRDAVADCTQAESLRARSADALYVGGLAKLRMGDTAAGNADIAAALDADYHIADLYALYGVTRDKDPASGQSAQIAPTPSR